MNNKHFFVVLLLSIFCLGNVYSETSASTIKTFTFVNKTGGTVCLRTTSGYININAIALLVLESDKEIISHEVHNLSSETLSNQKWWAKVGPKVLIECLKNCGKLYEAKSDEDFDRINNCRTNCNEKYSDLIIDVSSKDVFDELYGQNDGSTIEVVIESGEVKFKKK